MQFTPLGVGELVGGGIFALLLVLAVATKLYLLFGKKKKRKIPYSNEGPYPKLHGKKKEEPAFLGGESFLPMELLEEIFTKEEEQQTDGRLVV